MGFVCEVTVLPVCLELPHHDASCDVPMYAVLCCVVDEGFLTTGCSAGLSSCGGV